jgi:flavin reductase (DIM6/NTAB) family NADH-FMN oxidoreductase RutF
MKINDQDIASLDKLYRTQLINSLSGPRAVHLIGTCDVSGRFNCAIFNSVHHIGANPPLLGMICRPDSVERHTLDNIRQTGVYTINSVHTGFLQQAHQTSARYPREVSEIEAVGLESEQIDGFKAPFIKSSKLQIAMQLEDEIRIPSNGTILIIGKVLFIQMPEGSLLADGSVAQYELEPIVVVGLDSYGTAHRYIQLPYAKP